MPVPDNVLKLRECLEKLQIPGHFPHYNEAAFRNFKLKCTVHLNSGHFQPVSALCFGCCNYCILMRVIIDCWSQQMKINSLCISLMTFSGTHCSPTTQTSIHKCTQCISQYVWGIRTYCVHKLGDFPPFWRWEWGCDMLISLSVLSFIDASLPSAPKYLLCTWVA